MLQANRPSDPLREGGLKKRRDENRAGENSSRRIVRDELTEAN